MDDNLYLSTEQDVSCLNDKAIINGKKSSIDFFSYYINSISLSLPDVIILSSWIRIIFSFGACISKYRQPARSRSTDARLHAVHLPTRRNSEGTHEIILEVVLELEWVDSRVNPSIKFSSPRGSPRMGSKNKRPFATVDPGLRSLSHHTSVYMILLCCISFVYQAKSCEGR
jgi:hypothetical protein